MKNKHSLKLYKYPAVFVLAVGVMLTFLGCARDETVSTGVQTGKMTGDVPEDADTVTAPTDSADTTSSQNNTAVSLPEMDPATRQQLMTELLEESDLDSSVVEPERATKKCTFDVPEDFEESEETDNLYVTARYPLDASMIYYEVMDGDSSLQLMTEERFTEEVEESLSQLYGEEITVNMESFKSMKIDGYPAFRILCRYEVQGIEIAQLEYIINADKTYVVTYSQTNDYDRMEEYEQSAATIHIK